MKFDKSIVVGLKFYIGPMDLEGINTTDFIDAVQFKFTSDGELEVPDATGIYSGKNKLTCKYYDDEEGYMYVTFDKEVAPEDLPFFGEDEMIFKKVEE
jgi:hypothetical protein